MAAPSFAALVLVRAQPQLPLAYPNESNLSLVAFSSCGNCRTQMLEDLLEHDLPSGMIFRTAILTFGLSSTSSMKSTCAGI